MSETHEVSVPDLGKTDEISLIEWKIRPGDSVTKGAELAEVETMKSTFSLESPADGVVDQVLVEQGAKVHVGDTLARIKSS
ncbi:MAG: biotin/lipoyl-containing protein [Candidatus Bipolaricaulota bacterium]